MSEQIAQIQVGGWNCTCTVEESPEGHVVVVLMLSPNLDDMARIRASYRSTLTVQVDLGAKGLREGAITTARSSLGGGRVSVFVRLDRVRSADVRAVEVEFGGNTQRISFH